MKEQIPLLDSVAEIEEAEKNARLELMCGGIKRAICNKVEQNPLAQHVRLALNDKNEIVSISLTYRKKNPTIAKVNHSRERFWLSDWALKEFKETLSECEWGEGGELYNKGGEKYLVRGIVAAICGYAQVDKVRDLGNAN